MGYWSQVYKIIQVGYLYTKYIVGLFLSKHATEIIIKWKKVKQLLF